MTSQVNYELNESVATITLDDGKVNVLGPAMQSAINEALDRRREGRRQGGRDGRQPAGVQRRVRPLRSSSPATQRRRWACCAGGFELSVRCLTFPKPVIMAATGPAIAMGSFLLLSGDHRSAHRSRGARRSRWRSA
jgi:enoyl-CoA hydratase